MGGGHEQTRKNPGAARLRDKARDFATIRLAVTGPKVRTGGRCDTPRICCDAVADTERFNHLIEAQVHKVPDQYLWIHRRFKGLSDDYPDYYSDRYAKPLQVAGTTAAPSTQL